MGPLAELGAANCLVRWGEEEAERCAVRRCARAAANDRRVMPRLATWIGGFTDKLLPLACFHRGLLIRLSFTAHKRYDERSPDK